MAASQVAARTYKVTKHGIEVPTALTYKSWEPGGEYTKPLILKNVNLTSKKIRYKYVIQCITVMLHYMYAECRSHKYSVQHFHSQLCWALVHRIHYP